MKKLMTIFAILFATITFGQSLGDFPVTPNFGGGVAAVHRQRIIDAGATYVANTVPHSIDYLQSYGLWNSRFAFFPDNYLAGSILNQVPTDGSGDFDVARASVATNPANEKGLMEEVANNVARISFTNGEPHLLTEEQRTNELENAVHFYDLTQSGLVLEGDPLSAGSDQNVSSCVNSNYTTFGSASATGFAATSNGGGTHIAGTADEIVVTTTNVIKVAFTLTLNSGTAPTVAITDALAGSNLCNSKTEVSVAGSNVMYFFGTVANTGVVEFFNSSTATDFVIASLSVSEVTGFSAPHSDTDLSVSAWKLTEDGQTSTHYITKSLTVTNGTAVSLSIKAKQGERNWIRFEEIESSEGYYFDLDNGVIGTAIGTVDDYSITAMADGYWNVSITVTVPSTTAEFRVGLADADNSNSYAGDGSSGAYLAFAQLEEGSYPTSWIYSISAGEGATYTRLGDEVSDAGEASTFNSVEGVLYMESAALFDDLSNRAVGISDGTIGNTVFLFYTSSSQRIRAKMIVGSVTVTDLIYDVTDITDFHKIGFRWKVDDFSLWVDGVERATDVSGVSFVASILNELSFDQGDGTLNAYGKWKSVMHYNYLSNTEMAELTELGMSIISILPLILLALSFAIRRKNVFEFKD